MKNTRLSTVKHWYCLQHIREVAVYVPENGRWRITCPVRVGSNSRNAYRTTFAGRMREGKWYLLGPDGKDYRQSRINYLYAHSYLSEDPNIGIGHINGNKADDRIENLRFFDQRKEGK